MVLKILSIPEDNFYDIIDYLDMKTTCYLALVSKVFYKRITNSLRLWEQKNKQHGYFKDEKNFKANTIIGFSIEKVKRRIEEYIRKVKESNVNDINQIFYEEMQGPIKILELVDFFKLSNPLEKKNQIINDIFRDTETANILKIHIQKDLKKAKEITKKIPEKDKSYILICLVNISLQQGKIEEARRAIEKFF